MKEIHRELNEFIKAWSLKKKDLYSHEKYVNKEGSKIIDLNKLSSGEKQIVSLFSKIYLEVIYDTGAFHLLYSDGFLCF